MVAVELKTLCGGGPLAKNRIISAGMVLWSKTHPKMNCKVTFRTETTLQHYMIRFDRLKLDCKDRLLVFDTDHADSDPKVCAKFIHQVIPGNLTFFAISAGPGLQRCSFNRWDGTNIHELPDHFVQDG